MSTVLSRASFLRGSMRGEAQAIRPPWAVAESAFIEACTRCGDCISACAEGIVGTGAGGFPVVSFAGGECTFCGDCRAVCIAGAFLPALEGQRAWGLDVSVSKDCLGEQGVVCRLCEEQCEPRAIRFPRLGGAGVPTIDQDICTGCGACISMCPADAISARPLPATETAA